MGKRLFLFDVDKPLTMPRERIRDDILEALKKLRDKEGITTGFVGGSTIEMYVEQVGEQIYDIFDYCFAENGLVSFKGRKEIYRGNLLDKIEERALNKFISFILKYIADLEVPKKRGTFIQYRSGLLNVSPIGRDCNYVERVEFNEFDRTHKIRDKLIEVLKKAFPDLDLKYDIGGMISINIGPVGWDKTFCLNHIDTSEYNEIYFFGDNTQKGGNDYELYSHPDVTGFTVITPDETLKILKEQFL